MPKSHYYKNSKSTSINNNDMLSEEEVRKLRDTVYGHESTDKNWGSCKDNWMKSGAMVWLIDKADIKLKS